MRILHTADWHLGDRLGRIDRTDDLRRGVERIAQYCLDEKVDVLLVAGDLFSELSRPDGLRSSIAHLQQVFEPFLLGGGTILAVTGNHDNENFCQTLWLVMNLAAPASARPGDLQPNGRFYLATDPTFLRLRDRDGVEVQFLLMPYPSATAYLQQDETLRYASLEERNKHLQAAFARRLAELQQHPAFKTTLPTVLAAHVHVHGATLPNLFRINDEESIVFDETELPSHFTYVALGHIHQPQAIRGQAHVRYPGSIDRLDLGEKHDQKGILVLDIGPEGLRGAPRELPLQATPIYNIEISTPLREALLQLRDLYPAADRDLVHVQFRYTAGVDNLEETLRALDEIFPRWYFRHWTEANELGPTLTVDEARTKSFEDTVRDYLKHELMNHAEEDRAAVLARAEGLMKEVEA